MKKKKDYAELWDLVSPAEMIHTGAKPKGVLKGMALCLSGGGYRAMLFHVGVLWRMNETGFLKKLDRISSVSGGSITAGVLGMNWHKLDFDKKGVAREFIRQVVEPIRVLANLTIDAPSILKGIATPDMTISNEVAIAYSRHLFGEATLQDLPDTPRFVINATNVQSGVLWRFMKPYMADYRVGMIKSPCVPLAVAVAASSAFPPLLSPVTLEFDDAMYVP
ncbi:MAG: patatin-like phospholipase family protein, partial [Patescibacteria group bacterium]